MRALPYGAACAIGHSAATMPGTAAKAQRKVGEPRGRKPLLSDEKILELRALAEFAGWRTDALALRFEIDQAAVRRYASGVTRSRLAATRAHLPAGVRE